MVTRMLEQERHLTIQQNIQNLVPLLERGMLRDLVQVVAEYASDFDVMNWEDVWFDQLFKLKDQSCDTLMNLVRSLRATSVDAYKWATDSANLSEYDGNVLYAISYTGTAGACTRPKCFANRDRRCRCGRPVIFSYV